jgi:hypothetical protein
VSICAKEVGVKISAREFLHIDKSGLGFLGFFGFLFQPRRKATHVRGERKEVTRVRGRYKTHM